MGTSRKWSGRAVGPHGHPFEAIAQSLDACRGELLACDQVAHQERDRLGLDEALDPALNDYLRVARSLLSEIGEGLAAWGIAMDQPTPDAGLVASLTARIDGGS